MLHMYFEYVLSLSPVEFVGFAASVLTFFVMIVLLYRNIQEVIKKAYED